MTDLAHIFITEYTNHWASKQHDSCIGTHRS